MDLLSWYFVRTSYQGR